MLKVKPVHYLAVIAVFCLLCSQVYAREYCKIGGKKTSIDDIKLTTDIHIRGNSTTQKLYYTFYLDKRDLDISSQQVDRVLRGKSAYRTMAAIIVLYVNDVFKDYPCEGTNKCVKNIRVGVKGFFDFLNSNPELRHRYLDAVTSQSLFTPRYKNMDYFNFELARNVGYALYGISYMRADLTLGWTLMDKMIYSIKTTGNTTLF